MSVPFRAQLRSAITNAAYISKNLADATLAKLGLNDSDSDNNSGPAIDNAQKFINQIADTSGETEDDANRKIYSSTNYVADGDSRKVAIGKLDAQAQVNADGIQSINDSVGQPDGIAPLDSSGLVPSANLPSFVDDVLEFADLASFPATGDTGKIYVALDTGRIYRWSGATYIEVSQSPVDSVNGNTGAVVLDNTDIGLGNVTNDTQLKREAGDMNTFTEKLVPVVDDIVLIEDSEDLFNKKKVKLQNMLGGGGGGGLDTYYTQDFESFLIGDIDSSGNNATFNNGGTIDGVLALEATNPIDKETSLKYTAGSSSNNDWVVVETQTVYDLQRSKTNAILAQIDASDFSTDFDMVVYDETNSAVIESVTITGGTSLKAQALSFNIPSTCTTISYGFHFNDTPVDTEFVLIDNVELTTDPFKFTNVNVVYRAKAVDTVVGSVTNTPTSFDFDSIEGDNGLSSGAIQITRSGRYRVKIDVNTFGNGETAKVGYDLNGTITMGESFILSPSAGGTRNMFGEAFLVDMVAGDTLKAAYQCSITRAWLVGITEIELITTSDNAVVPSKSNMFDTKIVQGITIEGTTTDPTKGTVLIDQIEYSQKGDLGFFKYRYEQTTAGTIGSGIYLYSLPDGLEFSDDVPKTASTATTLTNQEVVSYGIGVTFSKNSASAGVGGFIVPYDSTRFRVFLEQFNTTIQVQRSGFFSMENSQNAFVFDFNVPIKGWTSENQFLSLIPVQKTAYIKDVKPSGTAGGTATSGSWQTRDLNTVEGDSEIVNLSSNQFTLQPGIYEIEANAQANQCAAHGIKIYNATDFLDSIIGLNSRASGVDNNTAALLYGKVIIESAKTFELQHRVGGTKATDGFGSAKSFGVDEVYAQVKITKVK